MTQRGHRRLLALPCLSRRDPDTSPHSPKCCPRAETRPPPSTRTMPSASPTTTPPPPACASPRVTARRADHTQLGSTARLPPRPLCVPALQAAHAPAGRIRSPGRGPQAAPDQCRHTPPHMGHRPPRRPLPAARREAGRQSRCRERHAVLETHGKAVVSCKDECSYGVTVSRDAAGSSEIRRD